MNESPLESDLGKRRATAAERMPQDMQAYPGRSCDSRRMEPADIIGAIKSLSPSLV
jgi:hypothetical protein